MGRKKLIRINQTKKMPNILAFPSNIKGRWKNKFSNTNPIIIELGCGKGEYIQNLSKHYKKINFIGIDRKADRLWTGATNCSNIKNALFMQAHAENIEDYFEDNEINEIWITFPDPQPDRKNEKKRLTSPIFLKKFKKILKKEGIIHLKTDNESLFKYSQIQLRLLNYQIEEIICNIHNQNPINETEQKNCFNKLSIKTTFEKKYISQNKPIYYLMARNT